MGNLVPCITTSDSSDKARALKLWEEDRAQLLFQQPFIASLTMQLEIVPVIDSRLDTASTDGRHIFVSAPFLLGLDPYERVFLLAHEVWHCALQHFIREGDRDHHLWNVAVDHEVNAMLADQGFKIPNDSILFPEWDGESAETVYEYLHEQKLDPRHSTGAPNEVDPVDCNGMSNVPPHDRGRLADDHDCCRQTDDAPIPFIVDPDYAPLTSNDGFTDWADRLVSAARQYQRDAGNLPGNLALVIDRYTKPQLPWRVILDQFVTSHAKGELNWSRPNRRMLAQGIFLPGRSESKPKLVVAIDTSGSVVEHLSEFMAEIEGVATAQGQGEIRLITCDAEVQDDVVYTIGHSPISESLSVQGGGGTDFTSVFDRVAETNEFPDALIYLTDGCGGAPVYPPPYSVLWVLVSNGVRPVEWGDVARLPSRPKTS